MKEYPIHPDHKVLFDAIVLDRRINEEGLLIAFKEKLSEYSQMTPAEFAEFETFSGFSSQEVLFATSFIRALNDQLTPSPMYLDRLIDQTAWWINNRSVMRDSFKVPVNGKNLGEIKTSVQKDVQVLKLEIKSLAKV